MRTVGRRSRLLGGGGARRRRGSGAVAAAALPRRRSFAADAAGAAVTEVPSAADRARCRRGADRRIGSSLPADGELPQPPLSAAAGERARHPCQAPTERAALPPAAGDQRARPGPRGLRRGRHRRHRRFPRLAAWLRAAVRGRRLREHAALARRSAARSPCSGSSSARPRRPRSTTPLERARQLVPPLRRFERRRAAPSSRARRSRWPPPRASTVGEEAPQGVGHLGRRRRSRRRIARHESRLQLGQLRRRVPGRCLRAAAPRSSASSPHHLDVAAGAPHPASRRCTRRGSPPPRRDRSGGRARSPSACSGAMYAVFPFTSPVWVSLLSSILAMPKSSTFTCPEYATITLCGDTSRWTTPSSLSSSSRSSCAACSPSHSSARRYAVRAGESPPSCSRARASRRLSESPRRTPCRCTAARPRHRRRRRAPRWGG